MPDLRPLTPEEVAAHETRYKADRAHLRSVVRHPTVKPLDLMRYLVRLVTPKGGTVMDCFAGTGTTGEAAVEEGVNAILIERDRDYWRIAGVRSARACDHAQHSFF